MSATTFVTLLTPLTALPIILGLIIGVWGCLMIITGAYGVDLSTAVPWVQIDSASGAPLLLFGVAVFALMRGQKLRHPPATSDHETVNTFGPLSWLERVCLASVGLGSVAIPYWLAFPMPEAWVIGGGLLAWIGWRKLSS